MIAHIQPTAASTKSTFTDSLISALSNTASSVVSSTVGMSTTSERAREVSEVDQSITVNSDAESVDTTAAVVFGSVVKMKEAQDRRKAMSTAPGPSSTTS